MDIRTVFVWIGLILLLGSWYFGDWAIWVGGPMIFLGIVFYFIDKE